ncbi:GntR family transcriptional regulator [Paracoccus onubensis]|uniref:GntR family transcriptional regulator n=1 Tax=Paracoccus onubensis TaxID=1675788 RepID=UPI002730B074|nr:GntR family transcriptional regulator [Paracoccus onubensis]MDP0926596.1 GntR family transcriptional regulator [Paracoccus onubensis]
MLDPSTYTRARGGTIGDSVSAWAFEELSRRIVEGELAPCEKITEESLVRDLGISRTPLREAIKQLEELGLIERQRNRTLRVAPLQSTELIELVRLREHIEGLAAYEVAKLVAEGAVETEKLWAVIETIENAEIRLEGSARIDRIFALGTEFHAELVELSGMRRVVRIHGGLQLALARYRLVNARDQRRLNHRSAEHRAILEAVESGNPEKAETAMRAHIREGLRAYTTNPDDGTHA